MSVQLAEAIAILISGGCTGAMTLSHALVYFRTNGKYGNGYGESSSSAKEPTTLT